MKRVRLGALIALILIVALYMFRGAGRWLDREDPLSRADIIFVLGGGMPQRAVEAGKVFAQGYAPEVWCSRPDSPVDDLDRLGIHYVGEEDYTRQILVHWTLWQKLVGKEPRALVHGADKDPFDPDHWWRNTRDVLSVVRETLGLLNAWAGLPVPPYSK